MHNLKILGWAQFLMLYFDDWTYSQVNRFLICPNQNSVWSTIKRKTVSTIKFLSIWDESKIYLSECKFVKFHHWKKICIENDLSKPATDILINDTFSRDFRRAQLAILIQIFWERFQFSSISMTSCTSHFLCKICSCAHNSQATDQSEIRINDQPMNDQREDPLTNQMAE